MRRLLVAMSLALPARADDDIVLRGMGSFPQKWLTGKGLVD